uniref:Nucleoprotein n=1 Tax=Xiangshan rhabdo-like virus 5 TaxID=2886228 RepID=A0A8K1YQQ4_9RHAB|nr:MAG: nucleocapsid protein [Xiangshan rhabdo-like virus 5]
MLKINNRGQRYYENSEESASYSFFAKNPETGEIESHTVDKTGFRGDYTYASSKLNNKPTVAICTDDLALPIGRVIGSLRQQIINRQLNIQTVKVYLALFYQERCQVETKDEWVSFGHKICDGDADQGIVITPLNIVEIINTTNRAIIIGAPIVQIQPELLDAYAAVCFGLSRYNDTQYEDYKIRILDHLVPLVDNQIDDCDKGVLNLLYTRCQNQSADQDYRKLVAAFDMFVYNFKECSLPYSKLRQMTIHSHHKDCNALSLLDFTMGKTNMKMSFINWFWLKPLVTEFFRIYKTGEELNQNNSYRPWGSFFGILTNSPYSTVANPNMTFFCHAICLALGSNWSANAIMPDCNPIPLIQNAALYLYAQNHSSDLEPLVSYKADIPSTKDREILLDDKKPRSTDVAEWGEYYVKELGSRLPEYILEDYYKHINTIRIPNDREGTIIRVIKQMISAHYTKKEDRSNWARVGVIPPSPPNAESDNEDDQISIV